MGVVSGTGIDTVLVRRLQDGDPGGHMRRAIARFPLPEFAEAALKRYFLPEGRPPGAPYKLLPMYRHGGTRSGEPMLMLAAFVEVYLAKEGHGGPVGMNLLTKVQHPNLALLYGAMLAGVDVILMGAGIPRDVPAALDAMAEHQPATLAFDVEGLAPGESEQLTIDPSIYWAGAPPAIQRPLFLPIIASNSLATMMARKASGRVDGFIIEGPTAGGHNAPPRGEMQLNERGEPLYGPRDEVDLAKIRQLGLPFWLAGGAGSPERLRLALDEGATGIQVGTLFAYCEESGLAEHLKRPVLAEAAEGKVKVRTDPRASPTGYPFKVVEWSGEATKAPRTRVCDLGYLRTPYRSADGKIAFRCASEPINTYIAKGGAVEETEGRECLCNALMANVALGQARADGQSERPLLTSGDDLQVIATFLAGRTRYGAADVIDYLLAGVR
jgi:NAD(P)H-dependent flavin oxidoreductase YrpB (nitropropane dioxygenase family)